MISFYLFSSSLVSLSSGLWFSLSSSFIRFILNISHFSAMTNIFFNTFLIDHCWHFSFSLFRAEGAVNGCVLHQTPGTRDGPGLRCRHIMAAHVYCHPSDPEHPPWERGPGPQGHIATSPASCPYPASHCWHF